MSSLLTKSTKKMTAKKTLNILTPARINPNCLGSLLRKTLLSSVTPTNSRNMNICVTKRGTRGKCADDESKNSLMEICAVKMTTEPRTDAPPPFMTFL